MFWHIIEYAVHIYTILSHKKLKMLPWKIFILKNKRYSVF